MDPVQNAQPPFRRQEIDWHNLIYQWGEKIWDGHRPQVSLLEADLEFGSKSGSVYLMHYLHHNCVQRYKHQGVFMSKETDGDKEESAVEP